MFNFKLIECCFLCGFTMLFGTCNWLLSSSYTIQCCIFQFLSIKQFFFQLICTYGSTGRVSCPSRCWKAPTVTWHVYGRKVHWAVDAGLRSGRLHTWYTEAPPFHEVHLLLEAGNKKDAREQERRWVGGGGTDGNLGNHVSTMEAPPA